MLYATGMLERPAAPILTSPPDIRSAPLALWLPLGVLPPIAVAAAIGLGLLVVFVAAVALPLATYTTALALFGLAHVGSELRYVDHRFGGRLPGGLGWWILAPLGLAVAVRLFGMTGWLSPTATVATELALAAVMAIASVVCMRRRQVLGAALALTLAVGAVLAPFQTLLALAIAHNLTPLAFVADVLEGRERGIALGVLGVPFVGLPLLIASGLPSAWLAATGIVDPDATPFGSGPLIANIGVYVPESLVDTQFALHLFSAAVFAQCMHYAVVIVLLPRLIDPDRGVTRTLVRWPRPGRFMLYLGAAGALLAAAFLIDFGAARRIYALAALVHSWIEIPILLLALGMLREPERVDCQAENG
jgi:hypothetical protein